MTESTAAMIANAISQNTTIDYIDLSSNRLGSVRYAYIEICIWNVFAIARYTYVYTIFFVLFHQIKEGGKQIQESIQFNKSLIELDLRLTECGQDSEYVINQVLKRNQELNRNARVEERNKAGKHHQRTYSHIFWLYIYKYILKSGWWLKHFVCRPILLSTI